MEIAAKVYAIEESLGTPGMQEGLESWPVTDRNETCRSSHRCPLLLRQEWNLGANILTVIEDIRKSGLHLTYKYTLRQN
jgi:hypothetical protein